MEIEFTDRYAPAQPSVWYGRVDSETDENQFRMHQVVRIVDLLLQHDLNPGFSLLGYACDEGVRRNKGNVGAAEGPLAFRKAFSNLAAHDVWAIHDLGDLTCSDGNLENTQAYFSKVVCEALKAKQRLIAIGGGHDIAYGHYAGIRAALGKRSKIGIINFDAHFDLRAVEEHPSSGTPFWQIAREDELNYCCIGIQPGGNTKNLFETAKSLGALVIHRHDMGNQNSIRSYDQFIHSVDHLYLTIDLDGFDMGLCPGVSAPTVNGFTYQDMLPYLLAAASSNKLISADIAELNPSRDPNQQTAKMAASLAFEIINNWS